MHRHNTCGCMPAVNCNGWSCLVCTNPWGLDRHGHVSPSKALCIWLGSLCPWNCTRGAVVETQVSYEDPETLPLLGWCVSLLCALKLQKGRSGQAL